MKTAEAEAKAEAAKQKDLEFLSIYVEEISLDKITSNIGIYEKGMTEEQIIEVRKDILLISDLIVKEITETLSFKEVCILLKKGKPLLSVKLKNTEIENGCNIVHNTETLLFGKDILSVKTVDYIKTLIGKSEHTILEAFNLELAHSFAAEYSGELIIELLRRFLRDLDKN